MEGWKYTDQVKLSSTWRDTVWASLLLGTRNRTTPSLAIVSNFHQSGLLAVTAIAENKDTQTRNRLSHPFDCSLERVLVENCLFNPFKDAARFSNDSPLKTDCWTTKETNKQRAPRRVMYYGEMCEGKFVSTIHCHPTIPGIIVLIHRMCTSVQ